jgi:hypothetical protein
VWAALVDLLAEDFLSDEADRVMTPRSKKIAFCWVLLGGKAKYLESSEHQQLTENAAAGMAIIGAFA